MFFNKKRLGHVTSQFMLKDFLLKSVAYGGSISKSILDLRFVYGVKRSRFPDKQAPKRANLLLLHICDLAYKQKLNRIHRVIPS